MSGIHFTAALTTGVAAAVFGILIYRLPFPARRRVVWLAAGLALPLQPLAFYLIRVPMDHWLAAHLVPTSASYRWLTTFYAPVTEELAKLIPLLVPAIYRDIRRENFVRYALAIGVGFAIGEMWFIADRLAQVPALAGLPFYQFGGYVSERLMVCIFHAAFVSMALWRLRRKFVLGIAAAVALHWLGNLPLSLMAWNVGNLGRPVWMIIVQCFLVLYFLASSALLVGFAFPHLSLGRALYGRRHCPECDRSYDGSLFALNFGRKRFERCPHCRHWHWTRAQEP